MSQVLSIETGFSCNAFCAFCPQINYRGEQQADSPVDLDTEQLRERIRYGAEQGYRQVGFSGGECTIRQDFVELVAYARELGYELIGVTSNGFRLAYPEYAEAIVKAGLNSVNISVHGPDARTHDAMMRTPGSFDLALRAIRNLVALRDDGGHRIELMSMCLASPQTLPRFPDTVRLMGQLGVRMHMIQPFIYTKGNTHQAERFMASYEALATAIREAHAVAQTHGGHLKLFNTPVCLFWDLAGDLERQWRELDVFREHEEGAPGRATRYDADGFYRVPECATCDEPCSGFRAEYYPQAAMAEEILAALEAHVAAHGREELWLCGTELWDAGTQRRVLDAVRRELGAGRVVLYHGGIGRSRDTLLDLAGRLPAEGGVDAIVLVPHPADPAAEDRRVRAHGNLPLLEEVAAKLRGVVQRRGEAGHPLDVAVSLSHRDAVEPRLPPPRALLALGATTIELATIPIPPEAPADHPAREPERVAAALEAIVQDTGAPLRLLSSGFPPGRFPDCDAAAATLAERMDHALIDPAPRLLRHPFMRPRYGWINWSVPPYAELEAHHYERAAQAPARPGAVHPRATEPRPDALV